MLVGVSGFFVMRENGITVELVDYIGILFCVIYIYIFSFYLILFWLNWFYSVFYCYCFQMLFFVYVKHFELPLYPNWAV